MDSSKPELLLGCIFEPQDNLFHSEGFPGTDAGAFSLPEPPLFPGDKLYEEWPVSRQAGLSDREDADEFLQMMINPNEVYSTEAAADQSPESDSGFSDDPRPDSPKKCDRETTLPQPTPVYELVYDIGAVEEQKVPSDMSSVISIQLGTAGHVAAPPLRHDYPVPTTSALRLLPVISRLTVVNGMRDRRCRNFPAPSSLLYVTSC
ncbi:hypothetical protein GDO78_018080 [Eleutherodactylus coqui]|uniref:Uncharacterized protein n=1 Tax=Eleutherodactylus coqui TaxID=57060 RepID=A0A8J6B0Z7_ELECQ|nr:hypothetical protein GDO78_018080 [Eleutherodactylus coqui]